jgi:2'-5' RNA ligase superfamily protein
MPHSLLSVPVPKLDAVVRARLRLRSPDEVPADDADPVAHITLLGPFADRDDITPGVLSELRWFFADVTSFAFTLTSVNRFPGGTVYLSPSPAAPFRQLTLELFRRFPEYPPYGGAFDDVVPHLSVPLVEGEDLPSVEHELGPRLPVTAQAQEAALYWWEPGSCGTIETFPFGTSVA